MSLTSRATHKIETPNEASKRAEGGIPGADQQETARYIAALSAELSTMASNVDLELLSYFLEMARMEAIAAASPGKRGRRKLSALKRQAPLQIEN
jgi:hypothetical protein